MTGRQLVPTIFSGVHQTRQRRLGPGRVRAGFAAPEYARRAMRRADRWANSPRTIGEAPGHIAELLETFKDVPR